MKVLIIAATSDERSGWGRLTAQLAHHLQELGATTMLCTEDINLEPTQLIPLRSGIVRAGAHNFYTVWKAAASADVIQAIDGWPYAVYGYIAAILRNKPLFVCGVGTYSVAPLRSFVKGLLLRRAYMHARAIFCISTYTKDRILAEVPRARASVVHMGTTTFTPVPEERVIELRAQLKLHDAYPLILTVGRIQDRKDQKSTLRAVALLKDEYPHIAYLMAGSDADAYAHDVRELAVELGIKDHVRIVNSAHDNYSLAALYQLCDLTALNSYNDKDHFEGFGLVIAEGYQFGKPAVGSRDCGIEDAIENGVTGYLTNQADPQDVARGIQRVLTEYEELSKNATVKATHWSWKKMAQAYIDAYHDSQ